MPELLIVVAVGRAAACGPRRRSSRRRPADTPTSTGILPPGVPTEGSRPPADGLPPAAETAIGAPADRDRSRARIVPRRHGARGRRRRRRDPHRRRGQTRSHRSLLLNADTGDIVGRTGVPGLRPPPPTRRARRAGARPGGKHQRADPRRPDQRQRRTADPHRHRAARRRAGRERDRLRRQRTRRHGRGDPRRPSRQGVHRQRPACGPGTGRQRHGPARRPQERSDRLRRGQPDDHRVDTCRQRGRRIWSPTSTAA